MWENLKKIVLFKKMMLLLIKNHVLSTLVNQIIYNYINNITNITDNSMGRCLNTLYIIRIIVLNCQTAETMIERTIK